MACTSLMYFPESKYVNKKNTLSSNLSFKTLIYQSCSWYDLGSNVQDGDIPVTAPISERCGFNYARLAFDFFFVQTYRERNICKKSKK